MASDEGALLLSRAREQLPRLDVQRRRHLCDPIQCRARLRREHREELRARNRSEVRECSQRDAPALCYGADVLRDEGA